MWLSNPLKEMRLVSAALAVIAISSLAACTVEPLNASRPESRVSSDTEEQSISTILAAIAVKPVSTRPAQQVRNQLLFALNGGQLQQGGQYSVALDVRVSNYNLSIENSSLSPTSAQVAIITSYQLLDNNSGKVVASGKRRAQSSYDRTTQSFANERAQRDAENRAAKEIAQQIRLSLAQSLADL